MSSDKSKSFENLCFSENFLISHLNHLKGKGTLFEKPHFPLSHGQIRAHPKGKKIGANQKNSNLGSEGSKKCQNKDQMSEFFWDNGLI